MAGYLEVLRTDELTSGQMKEVSVDGKSILVAKAGDTFYAADNTCPHLKGNLSQGTLEGTVVTCPLHHSQFDLKDGHNIRWTDWNGFKLTVAKVARAPRPLVVYEVKIEGNKVMVGPERLPVKPD
jgi:3-phenylpropionate/trans-cinnamate dioxygenase ferredoxin subunit